MALVGEWASYWQGHEAPNHVIDMVVQMASLLTALQSWEIHLIALNCKSMAKKFKRTTCPTI